MSPRMLYLLHHCIACTSAQAQHLPSARRTLAEAGLKVMLLEARELLGGRICTVNGHVSGLPLEHGAEFVHGARVLTHRLLEAAGVRVL